MKRGLSERSVRHVCETEKKTLIEDSIREVSQPITPITQPILNINLYRN